jgi:predicted RNA methylase
MGKTDINNLGQYWTPDNIAEYMSYELLKVVPDNGLVLDPCIGKNIFFSYLSSSKLHLTGIEIDKNLVSSKIRSFYDNKNRKLVIGDFIEFSFNQKFDAIVMNPPYTRHEKLSSETKFKLSDISRRAGINISAKANLYLYFVIKSLLLLKDGGTLIAITYDSWLYSSFGDRFKKYLLENYSIKKIIHFKHEAFDGVDIGATVLIIQKIRPIQFIEYLEYNSAKNFLPQDYMVETHKILPQELLGFNEHTTKKNKIDFSEKYFQPLSEISEKTPWRGTSSPSNRFFVFREYSDGLTPVLKKTPKDNYSATKKDCVFAFSYSVGGSESSVKMLQDIKINILSNKNKVSDSLREKITHDEFWYKFPIKQGGNIIFNYYFRNNPKFILNTEQIPTMGNYYNLVVTDVFEYFALLNSSLTRYVLERDSKSQGRGLRKIQLNRFLTLPIIKLSMFDGKEIEELKMLGVKLSASKDHEPIIKNIDAIVVHKYCQNNGLNIAEVNEILNLEQ